MTLAVSTLGNRQNKLSKSSRRNKKTPQAKRDDSRGECYRLKRQVFSWCAQKGYCDVNPVVAAMPSKAKRKEIMNAKRGRRKLQVLTPAEVQMLLTYCEREEPTLTPYACLCIWGGLRPEREAPNMIDDDITTESVTVPEEFAKDNETRIIEPLSDNFIEWIEFIKGREGSFQPVKNLKRKWEKAKKSIDREWPHDCLRHSYASYHFAMYRDVGLTAKNLGHPNPTLLRKDYNNAVTRSEAARFWEIAPGGRRGEVLFVDMELHYDLFYTVSHILK